MYTRNFENFSDVIEWYISPDQNIERIISVIYTDNNYAITYKLK